MGNIIKSYPAIHPAGMLIVFVVIPPFEVMLIMHNIWSRYHWRGGFWKRFTSNFAVVLNHYSPLVSVVTLFFGIILMVNQGALIMNFYNVSSDVKYYVRSGMGAYTDFNLIFNAQALNSVEAIRKVAKLGFSRRLESSEDGMYGLDGIDGLDWKVTLPEQNDEFDYERRLQATTLEIDSDAGRILNYFYFREGFENIIEEDYLRAVCLTEQNIRNIPCLENATFNAFNSFIPNAFDDNCDYLTSFKDVQDVTGYAVFSSFFGDATMYSTHHSNVLITYSTSGSCDHKDDIAFGELMRKQSVDGTQIAFASSKYLNDEFRRGITDSQGVVKWTAIITFIFLVVSLRGFICALATMFCIALSVINAAAFLIILGYGAISVYNVMVVLVMCVMGATFSHMYGVAWRREVRKGKHSSPDSLLRIFESVEGGHILALLAGLLAAFSLTSSPVTFMSQIGYSLGFAMLTYFIAWHYIVVPLWVWTSWYCLPESWHNNWRMFRQKYCFCFMVTKHDHHHHEGGLIPHHHHQAGHHPHHPHHPHNLNQLNELGARPGTVTVTGAGVRTSTRAGAGAGAGVAGGAVVPAPAKKKKVNCRDLLGEGSVVSDAGEESDSGSESGSSSSSSSGSSKSSKSSISRVEEVKEEEEEVAVVAADQVRYASHNEGKNVVTATVARMPGEEAVEAEMEEAVEADLEEGESGRDAAHVETRQSRLYYHLRNTAPIKLCGQVALLVTIAVLVASITMAMAKYSTDLGLIMLVDNPSNLATVGYIFSEFRSDTLLAVDDDNSAILTVSEQVILTPTAQPTLFSPPTPTPTAAPSASAAKSVAPTTVEESTFTDYTVIGCYGLFGTQLYRDSGTAASFDYYGFRDYTNSGDILLDLEDLCNYVDDNLEYLNVHPQWNRERDCLSDQLANLDDQYSKYYPETDYKISMNILIWGITEPTAPNLIGLLSNETLGDTVPVWVCANFTARTQVSDFRSHTKVGLDMEERWKQAFKRGSTRAGNYGIGVSVASPDMAFKLLGAYVGAQLKVVAITFVLVYAAVLVVFTSLDFGMVLFTILGLFALFFLTVCVALYNVDSVVNMGDAVGIVLLLPFMICFSGYLMSEYRKNRHQLKQHHHHHIEPYLRNKMSPALAKTNRYMSKALTGPLIVGLIASAPFYKAEYPVLRRFAGYFIVCALVSWFLCLFLQPYLLALSYRWTICDRDAEEEEYEPPPVAATADTGIAMVSQEHYPTEPYAIVDEEEEYGMDGQMGVGPMGPMGPGSQYDPNAEFDPSMEYMMVDAVTGQPVHMPPMSMGYEGQAQGGYEGQGGYDDGQGQGQGQGGYEVQGGYEGQGGYEMQGGYEGGGYSMQGQQGRQSMQGQQGMEGGYNQQAQYDEYGRLIVPQPAHEYYPAEGYQEGQRVYQEGYQAPYSEYPEQQSYGHPGGGGGGGYESGQPYPNQYPAPPAQYPVPSQDPSYYGQQQMQQPSIRASYPRRQLYEETEYDD
ncbi:hypothetical protein B484DRAFT_453026 [Ochromonadaceae sp. CCMP2298]|nr:hypothetical protein B484DRAFT_453026 [Ochromonadaceae sp. CCMP2298]